ncbi:MAG: hypothetical protein ABWY04_21690 [Arthrobacter sp.]
MRLDLSNIDGKQYAITPLLKGKISPRKAAKGVIQEASPIAARSAPTRSVKTPAVITEYE